MVLMSEKFLPQGPGLEALDLPDPRALLVVGDVHGQAPALRALLDAFGARATPGLGRIMIFLGDLIDRGPDSLGCLQAALCEAQDRARVDTVHYLPGNHELMLTDGIDAAVAIAAGEGDPRDLGPRTPAAAWMMNGGHAFLQEVFPDMNERQWRNETEMFLDFADALPHPGHGSFLGMVRSWPSHVRIGDLLFVHAGLAPKRPFAHTLELTRWCQHSVLA